MSEPETTETKVTIALTLAQFKLLGDVLNDHRDDGPDFAGWKSPELLSLITVIDLQGPRCIVCGLRGAHGCPSIKPHVIPDAKTGEKCGRPDCWCVEAVVPNRSRGPIAS